MARATLRRRSLMATAAAAAVWLAGLPAGAAAGERSLRALCRELDCPPSIGTACLRALSVSEQGSQSLIAAIFGSLPPDARRAASAMTLARVLAEQSRKDFGAGRIVIADGWMLSRTEALLYALTALLAGPGTDTG